jgi:glycosyltransferase involved in cell wall biosynthesis
MALGGSCRSILSIAKSLQATGQFEVTIVSLNAQKGAEEIIEEAGVTLIDNPTREQLFAAIEAADIVQVDWWNNPKIYDFLRLENLPPTRMCAFVHAAGDNWPNLLTKQVLDFVDHVVPCCRYGSLIPLLRKLPPETYREKVQWAFATTNFNRLEGLKPQQQKDSFNIGYVGTVDFKKMHPGFVKMSAAVNIPSVIFSVLGNGKIDLLKKQVDEYGMTDKFQFHGFVNDIRPLYEKMDVIGYPLCDAPGAELAIQDALYAGIPCVVFGLGGLQDLIIDNFNGLVVNTEKEYSEALEYLYHHPGERKIMGENARRFAVRVLGAENSARRMKNIYCTMMQKDKRTRKWRNGMGWPSGQALISGSAQFIESLGHQAGAFLLTLNPVGNGFSKGIEQLQKLSAREKAQFLWYVDYYPEDPYLHFWLGVMEQAEVGVAGAEIHFQQALDNGLPVSFLEQFNNIPSNS